MCEGIAATVVCLAIGTAICTTTVAISHACRSFQLVVSPRPLLIFVGGFNNCNSFCFCFCFTIPTDCLPCFFSCFAASCDTVEITGGYASSEGFYTQEGTRNGESLFVSSDGTSELFYSNRDDETRRRWRNRRLPEDLFGEPVLLKACRGQNYTRYIKTKKKTRENAYWVSCCFRRLPLKQKMLINARCKIRSETASKKKNEIWENGYRETEIDRRRRTRANRRVSLVS